MRLRSVRCRVVPILLMGGSALAACSGSLFQSKTPPTAVYLLSADLGAGDPAAPAPANISEDLAVLRPRVRAGLETDRIAVLYPDHRLDYIADARWSGPLDEVMQDLAMQAFQTGSRLRNVSADASAFSSAYWLELEIANFEADYVSGATAPVIRVRLQARLGRAGDRHMLLSFDSDVSRPATDNRLPAIIDAYQRAVDAALADIVANTTRAVTHVPDR